MPRLRPPFPAQSRLPRAADADQQRRDPCAHPRDPQVGRCGLAARPALVRIRRGSPRRMLRGAARRHRPAADRGLRGRRDRGDRGDRPRRRGERDPAAGRARRAADARRAGGVGRRPGLGRRSRSSRPRIRCSGCSPRRCGSSPRSRARSARRAGSATARCTTSSRSSQVGRAAMTRAKVEEWLEAMAETSICGLGQASPFPVRSVFRHWPELVAPLGGASLG